MRRSDKEIVGEAALLEVLEKATVCRLAMVDGDRPYVVPLCFGYRDNALYLHGSAEGRKVAALRQNPRVCFEFDLLGEPLESENACRWSMRYQSVIGFGEAVFVEEPDEKRRALDTIMAHYSDREFRLADEAVAATAVIRVEIESMTGKQSGIR